jgi:hypothetical protein
LERIANRVIKKVQQEYRLTDFACFQIKFKTNGINVTFISNDKLNITSFLGQVKNFIILDQNSVLKNLLQCQVEYQPTGGGFATFRAVFPTDKSVYCHQYIGKTVILFC